MPELPEVEVVRRGLDAHVVAHHVVAASLRGARVARRHEAGPRDLEARLTGQDVLAADRRGKYLWLVLGTRPGRPTASAATAGPDSPAATAAPDSRASTAVSGLLAATATPGGPPEVAPSASGALVVHLGMSGQLLVEAPDAPPERHLHAVLDLCDDADHATQLRFVDQRTFGGLAWADLVADPWARAGGEGRAFGIPASVAHVAPDPLEPAFDRAAVVRRMKAKDVAIKRALLDQRLVSGIGNIYADEALWRARVNGLRLTSALTRPALGRVLDHAAEVMREALDQGGTSFDALYVNVNGASGYFDRSLHAYGQQGRPCPRCGTPIRREAFMNRSSHYCPRCQPRPRRPRGAA